VFTGFGKGSGKTTFFHTATLLAQKDGPVGIFTIGFDGIGKEHPSVKASVGDVVITTIPLARAAEASLDVIEELPGRSAIGHLCIGRVVRAGSVTLVGPEHFSQLVFAIDLVRQSSLVKTVLVDGAAGRITQVAAVPDAQFLYCARADTVNARRVAENIEMVFRLSELPLETGADINVNPSEHILHIQGPLTTSVMDSMPKAITHISIDTFSDCFLDAQSFSRALQRFTIAVRRRIPLLGFAVALKNIKREDFLKTTPLASAKILFNPLEAV
jgi:hypothetical protein